MSGTVRTTKSAAVRLVGSPQRPWTNCTAPSTKARSGSHCSSTKRGQCCSTGVTAGEAPTPTSMSTEALAETALLGEPLSNDGETSPRSKHLRSCTETIDDLSSIAHPSRLIVVALPPEIDWERARAVAHEYALLTLDRMKQVLGGAYSRRAAVVRIGSSTLFLGAEVSSVVIAVPGTALIRESSSCAHVVLAVEFGTHA
jgi:hypothetical protein